MTANALLAEMHPGRTVLEDVLRPPGVSVNALAKELHIPTTRLKERSVFYMNYARWSCGCFYSWAFLVVFLAAEAPLLSQVGPRPGVSRRNYPGGGLGFPMPDLPAVNYKGKLMKIDDKVIVLELDDGRTASFERSHKTKFYKDSKEVKASDLRIGDRVSVEATEDPQAYLDALKVTFDNSPPPDEHSEGPSYTAQSSSPSVQYDDNGRPTLRKRNPTPPEQTGSQESASSRQEGTGSREQGTGGDNGRPTLRRRNAPEPEQTEQGTGNREQEAGEHTGTQEASNAVPSIPSSGGRIETSRAQDPVIEKARGTTVSSSDKLPNFICQETMARATRDSNESSWQPIDTMSTDVVYEDGKESHRNLKINDRPADNKMEEPSGSWPIGKLVTTLSDLFAPATAAQFRYGGETNLPNLQARVYDFDVVKENSQWIMRMGSQSITAAYGGSVWIDKESGRVLRLEMQARDLPEAFPVDRLETNVEYSFVRLGEASALMPMHVETMGCQRGTQTCSRNVIDFRNYRKNISGSDK